MCFFRALHLAAMAEQDESLEILLLHGANPNIDTLHFDR